jgi:uncharacterized protein (DUF736 family)
MTIMKNLSNFIHFDGNSFTGNLASLAYDINITGQRVSSSNEKAPIYRVFAKSPAGRDIEIGGIWENQRQDGTGTYKSLIVNTGHSKLRANLGRFPGQDDENLMAVIPWND